MTTITIIIVVIVFLVLLFYLLHKQRKTEICPKKSQLSGSFTFPIKEQLTLPRFSHSAIKEDGSGLKFTSYNPSILLLQNGEILYSLRVSNYNLCETNQSKLRMESLFRTNHRSRLQSYTTLFIDESRYWYLDIPLIDMSPKRREKSSMGVVRVNSSMGVDTNTQIREVINTQIRDTQCVKGYEDCRLVAYKNAIYGLFSYYDSSIGCTFRVVLVRICTEDDLDKETKTIRTGVPVILHYEGMRIEKNEKNWMPLIKDGKLYFIAEVYPQKVLELIDDKTGKCSLLYSSSNIERCHLDTLNDYTSGKIRGGTQLIYLENMDKYIAVCHVVKGDKEYHSLLYIVDGEIPFKTFRIGRIGRIGKDISVQDRIGNDISDQRGKDLGIQRGKDSNVHGGIEFASGLCVVGKDILLAYGYMDCRGILVTIDISNLDLMV